MFCTLVSEALEGRAVYVDPRARALQCLHYDMQKAVFKVASSLATSESHCIKPQCALKSSYRTMEVVMLPRKH